MGDESVHRRERAFHSDRRAYAHNRRFSSLGYRGGVNSAKDHLTRAVSGFGGTTVLDLGCGEGWLSREIKGQFETVVSLDIVTEVLSEDLCAVCGAAEALPFADSTFDAVVGSGVLHHAADLPTVMSEIDRVLKSGGSVAFAEPLRRHPLVVLYRRLTPRARSVDEHPFTLEELLIAFKGMDEVDLKPLDLTTVLAAPLNAFRLLQSEIVPRVTKRLRRLDGWLMRRWPLLGSYAWCAVISARSQDRNR
jgi:SAM-dependent methyltransferase